MLHIVPEYPYVYETHLHTSQGSRCGRAEGSRMAAACAAAGYTGIFVTDHHWGGNTRPDRALPWADWCREFAAGYEDARIVGESLGLDVWFGWEAGFTGTEFLIYGLTPDWMAEHPELSDPDLTPERQFALIDGAGGMVIQAHPFRREPYIPEVRLFPHACHGAEGYNAAHSARGLPEGDEHYTFNPKALAYAAANRLPITAGSDVHTTNLFHGGMAFRRRLAGPWDFIRAVRYEEDCLYSDGVFWYGADGKRVARARRD